MNAAELAMQEAITASFILADPEEIQLYRSDKVTDGAGGFIQSTSQSPMSPQTVRMIPRTDAVEEMKTVDGHRPIPPYTLLAGLDVDVERYDIFAWRGTWWEITEIHDKPDYEIKADVNITDRRP
jgi:hypothetical protein